MNFEGEISPEELFNMFFNGGFEGMNFQPSGFGPMFVHHFHAGGQRARRRPKQQEQPLSWIAIALQIIPVAIVGLFLFLGSFLGTSNASTNAWDAYSQYVSLSKTSSHIHQMATGKNNIQYWATKEYQKYFSRGNQRDLRVYEEAVERQYLVEMQKKCQEEELDLQKRKVNAKDREELERLQMEKCPSCDKLHSYSV
jgi:DnaJ family protein B protein 12